MPNFSNWLPRGGELFRGEIPRSEHMVQIYEEDDALLDSLEGFVRGGLQAGEGVIVIATSEHLALLEDRLVLHGMDIATARFMDRYVDVVAEEVLPQMLANGWPDEVQFRSFVRRLAARARGGRNRRIRVFGELVTLTWSRGHHRATLHLEGLCHQLSACEGFPLFCAYPRSVVTSAAAPTAGLSAIESICASHSAVIT